MDDFPIEEVDGDLDEGYYAPSLSPMRIPTQDDGDADPPIPAAGKEID